METAMQEIQRRLFDVRIKQNPITLDEINRFIEKEKQQIIDAFETGYDNGACVQNGESIYHGNNYYKKKFKQY